MMEDFLSRSWTGKSFNDKVSVDMNVIDIDQWMVTVSGVAMVVCHSAIKLRENCN